ncbi:MAG: hypothetical protein AAB630_01795 [Patescibacteria group bacterium]
MEKPETCFFCYGRIKKKVMAPEVVQSIAEGRETISSVMGEYTVPKEVYCQGTVCWYLHTITMGLKRRVEVFIQKTRDALKTLKS